jgi:hypothetical protein
MPNFFNTKEIDEKERPNNETYLEKKMTPHKKARKCFTNTKGIRVLTHYYLNGYKVNETQNDHVPDELFYRENIVKKNKNY